MDLTRIKQSREQETQHSGVRLLKVDTATTYLVWNERVQLVVGHTSKHLVRNKYAQQVRTKRTDGTFVVTVVNNNGLFIIIITDIDDDPGRFLNLFGIASCLISSWLMDRGMAGCGRPDQVRTTAPRAAQS